MHHNFCTVSVRRSAQQTSPRLDKTKQASVLHHGSFVDLLVFFDTSYPVARIKSECHLWALSTDNCCQQPLAPTGNPSGPFLANPDLGGCRHFRLRLNRLCQGVGESFAPASPLRLRYVRIEFCGRFRIRARRQRPCRIPALRIDTTELELDEFSGRHDCRACSISRT